jgi:hypothetical protein
MPTYTVKLTMKQWGQYMQQLGPRFKATTRAGMVAGANRCIPTLQQATVDAPPASDNGTRGAFDTGIYRAAWRATVLPNGARVYNSRPQAPVIEGGRRASPVSASGIKNLEGWAHRKLKLPANEARSAAFAIAKTLQKRPLYPRKVMGGVVPKMTKIVTDEVTKRLKAELARKP